MYPRAERKIAQKGARKKRLKERRGGKKGKDKTTSGREVDIKNGAISEDKESLEDKGEVVIKR